MGGLPCTDGALLSGPRGPRDTRVAPGYTPTQLRGPPAGDGTRSALEGVSFQRLARRHFTYILIGRLPYTDGAVFIHNSLTIQTPIYRWEDYMY